MASYILHIQNDLILHIL